VGVGAPEGGLDQAGRLGDEAVEEVLDGGAGAQDERGGGGVVGGCGGAGYRGGVEVEGSRLPGG